ncbi:MAG: phosphatase PAP2 family protein [Myxococcaceae bacterium]
MTHLVLTLAFTATVISPSGAVPPNAVDERAWLHDDGVHVYTRFEAAPRVSFGTFVLNTGLTLARPLQPKPTDAFVIVPAIIAAGLAWNYDVALHDTIRNRLPDPIVLDHRFSYWLSYGGEGAVDVAIFGLLAMADGKRGERAALAGMTALTAAGVASRVGKVAFRLERPSYDPTEKHLFSDRLTAADSMPSGHTMAAFATAAVIAGEYPKFAPFAYGLATWVAIARVQQSTHWVSDTIVGAGMGLLFGWAAVELTHRVTISPTASPDGVGAAISGAL